MLEMQLFIYLLTTNKKEGGFIPYKMKISGGREVTRMNLE